MEKALKNIFPFVFISVFFFNSAVAQKVKPLNLATYDKERLHFGFSLGVNKADFLLFSSAASLKPDSVLSVETIPDWGFNLGIISDLRLHDYVTLRFMPALTFQDRTLEYRIDSTSNPNPSVYYVAKKKVESTLLDFPLNLKIRSERLNNISAYLLVGGKFSIDLASQEKTKNPDIVKLNGKDFSFEAGFGLDFYLEYFKLSTEIKFAAGMKNRIFHEAVPTTWSSPIEILKTKTWLFSLNFEG